MKVAVLGSSGSMGSFFAKYFLENGNEVMGFDIRGATGTPAGVHFAKSNAEAVRRAELVLVAVPIQETVKVVREVSPFMVRGSRLVEIGSVKRDIPVELRRILISKRVSLLSIHPLFGPLARMNGSKICVIGGRRALSASRLLFPEAKVLPMRATDHDKLMAFAISLVHLTNMAIISVLVKGIGVNEFEKVAPPMARAQLNLGRAVLSQNPSLFAHIQADNPFVADMLSSVIAELDELKRSVGGGDVAGLQKKVATLAREFTRVELDSALQGIYSCADGSASSKN